MQTLRSFVVFSPVAALLTLGLLGPSTATAQDSPADVVTTERVIDFSSDVQPTLNQHCVACHGGVKQLADISFVYQDQVVSAPGEQDKVIVPGDLEASEFYHRITSDDEEYAMPPPLEDPAGLSDVEKQTLIDWVKQGAKWEKHWAYIKPEPQELPTVGDTAWPRNRIDHFVLSRLEQEQITPAPSEAPEVWLRRVSLDLIGLPPTPEQRQQFLDELTSNETTAYEAAVDRLLASPRFGERWASVWLDLVRYADSKGLGKDDRRDNWRYRDWVIQALNEDMPYDEFTVKQMAGDLLPNWSVEDQIATGVHRLTQTNSEGGTDDEEFRVAAVVDRINTTWQTWQGVTFGCVQCHNHPYDPFRHEEYYGFMAFFNNTADTDLNEESPTINAPLDPADYGEASRIDHEMVDLRQAIWEKEFAQLNNAENWRPLAGMTGKTNNAAPIEIEHHEAAEGASYDEFVVGDPDERSTDITIEADLPEGMEQLTAIRFTGLPRHPETALANSEWGFVVTGFKAELLASDGAAEELALAYVIGDEAEPFQDPNESLNARSRRGFGAYSRINQARQAAFVLEEAQEVPAGSRIRFTITCGVFSTDSFPLITHRGNFAVSDSTEFQDLLADQELAEQKEQLAALGQERRGIRSTRLPIMQERPTHLARPTHVFERGSFTDKGQQVTAGTPEIFPELPADKPADRLALAEWLVSPENPLTARVAVNRYWARVLGVGLLETEEDFGSSGVKPSHPALLDDLAVRFQTDMNWSVKKLLREIVLSNTYRQSAKIRPELLEQDSQNRLLARGPRVRMSAEAIRDQALAIAGLISDEMYGRPATPPIPAGVWTPFQGNDRWRVPEEGDPERYRRSVYTYVKRSIPYPMFATFDAPSREFCTPRRLRSNTPLQAFMTLNDETYVECAAALGKRMAAAADNSEDQLRAGFLLATSREARDMEIQELKKLYDTTAESKDQAAALQAVASVLLNLDEVLTK